ncbi:efflux RND transporter periplasmic adaptor subunit [Roseivirga sp. UBA838]|uniref:efflux RND transporter periplasmic adaptor subunit n=1 Tax=Roseivirga sp. UBA838 TaxID=1947393 RepID=UPI00257F24F3|nr:efflux RND transporter periplasmic adaptor subunit [Roseivirga sp. UBA838]|tara:strand:- start:94395 stop:95771 length:1377 start_codon:yes stop_codon:yes gene_type:complete
MAKKKKGSNRIVWILLIAVAAIMIFAIVGKQAGFIGGAKTLSVEMAKVSRNTIIEKVTASGVVQPVTEIIISPDVAGEIIELNVEEGDFVNEGMVLVKIRPDNLQSALDRAQANLNQQLANLASAKANKARSEAQLTQAELAFKRAEQLRKENVISDADFETAQSNYLTAKYNLEAAEESVKAAEYIIKSSQATVDEAKENVRLTVVTAPASGTISKLNVEKGERVVGTQQMAGTEMMRLADLNQMQVEVDVNENDIIRVSVGDTSIIDVDSYSQMDKKFKGIVTQIANTANPKASADAVTEFKVEIRILNESFTDLLSEINGPSPFRPGMTASVEIITTTKQNVLSVPLAAVTTRNPNFKGANGENDNETTATPASNRLASEDNLKEVVFVNEGGVAKMVEVTTGISDFDNIEILSGLDEGQEVISGPFFVVSKRLKDGDLVEKMQAKKPAAAPATN